MESKSVDKKIAKLLDDLSISQKATEKVAVKESVSSDHLAKDVFEDLFGKLDVKNRRQLRITLSRLQKGHFKKIIVLSGAGVSTSAGIPDFRTAKTGLYDNLEEYELPYPEAIFDLEFYRENPRPFTRLARTMLPGSFKPTPSHNFIRHLHDNRLLLRNFTQNIDGLEIAAGIPETHLVQAHGSFQSASCIDCRLAFDIDELKAFILDERIANCVECKGLVKPDITFFGENLPERFHRLSQSDFKDCDLMIVMGTSLSVYPFAGLVRMAPGVSKILINRELAGDFDFANRDAAVLGDLDDICSRITDYLAFPAPELDVEQVVIVQTAEGSEEDIKVVMNEKDKE